MQLPLVHECTGRGRGSNSREDAKDCAGEQVAVARLIESDRAHGCYTKNCMKSNKSNRSPCFCGFVERNVGDWVSSWVLDVCKLGKSMSPMDDDDCDAHPHIPTLFGKTVHSPAASSIRRRSLSPGHLAQHSTSNRECQVSFVY